MKRRTFVANLGTGGIVGLGSCAMIQGPSYSIQTPTADVCERDSALTNVVRQFAAPTDIGTDHWAAGQPSPVGHLELYGSAERARAALPLATLSTGRKAIEAFIDDTYFRNAMLLYVASVGPTVTHDRIRLCGLRLENGEIRGRAVVPPRADVEEDGQQTYPSALVRVIPGAPLPERARLPIETARGRTREFVASVTDD